MTQESSEEKEHTGMCKLYWSKHVSPCDCPEKPRSWEHEMRDGEMAQVFCRINDREVGILKSFIARVEQDTMEATLREVMEEIEWIKKYRAFRVDYDSRFDEVVKVIKSKL